MYKLKHIIDILQEQIDSKFNIKSSAIKSSMNDNVKYPKINDKEPSSEPLEEEQEAEHGQESEQTRLSHLCL